MHILSSENAEMSLMFFFLTLCHGIGTMLVVIGSLDKTFAQHKPFIARMTTEITMRAQVEEKWEYDDCSDLNGSLNE